MTNQSRIEIITQTIDHSKYEISSTSTSISGLASTGSSTQQVGPAECCKSEPVDHATPLVAPPWSLSEHVMAPAVFI